MNLLIPAAALLGAIAATAARAALRRASIPLRAPWPELATAAASVVPAWRAATEHLPTWWLPVPLILTWFAVPLVAADLARRRLPDVLTISAYPAFATAITFAALTGPGAALLGKAALGIAVFGGAHLLVRAVSPSAMGGGDVKLAGSLGGVLGALGWAALALTVTLAATVTAALAIGARSRHAPHGPGLLAATWLVATFSSPITG
jgi:leader peptidase (prepilin peptidase)/N-methyltransferase